MQVFDQVVKAGSFVNAADRLGLTSSAVSKKISQLEKRLDVRLFNRTTRSLSLTELGKIFHGRVQTILAEIEDAEDAVRKMRYKPAGELRIGASDALSVEIIVPFLKTFSAAYPEISITLVQADGGIDLLREHVEIALLFNRPSETSFIVRKIVDDPWVICASPQYLERHGTPDSPAELKNHKCLTIHAKSQTSNVWRFENHEDVKINSCFSGIGLTVKAATLQGLGIARLANFLIKKELASGSLEQLFPRMLKNENRAIYAVYPNREHLPAKTRVFIDAFEKYLAQSN